MRNIVDYRYKQLAARNFICVSKTSSKPPNILGVCREARTEGLKFYKRVMFDQHPKPDQNKEIYFNQEADVVYFGKLANISAMVYFLERRLHVPCIAINLDFRYRSTGKNNTLTAALRNAVGPNVDLMLHILHGFDSAIVSGNGLTWPGCSGWKEITWVVNCKNSWDIEPGHIDDRVSLRSIEWCPRCDSKGLPPDPFTTGTCQCSMRRYALTTGSDGWGSLKSQIENVASGKGLLHVGKMNKWVGQNKPVFRYANLFRSKDSDYLTVEIKGSTEYFLMTVLDV